MKIQKNKLIALIFMLIPVISIIGVIIYMIDMLKGNYSMLEIILVILTIPFGFIAAIFLWLNALGVLKL
ncbi:MAG: hypothetical protein IKG36_03000 [Mycoplasmataceae bacterium]|nr:hypothetical protein [Mycoplasmataceae bacterium]